MTKKRNKCKVLIIVLAAVTIGTGGFFLGRAAESSTYKAEQERNIMLNRSDLDGLGEIRGRIYVLSTKGQVPETANKENYPQMNYMKIT